MYAVAETGLDVAVVPGWQAAGMEQTTQAQQAQRARAFVERHRQPGCFVVPNAWDIGSARMLVAAGFPAIATTSAGDRIRAAREVVDRAGVPFVLVGRTDSLLVHGPDGLADCVRRGNALREAGADCVFTPGADSPETIATVVAEVDAPINVVAGLSGAALSVRELEDLGVRRVTVGGSLARAMYHQLRQAARELYELGTFSYAERQIPQAELNQLFS